MKERKPREILLTFIICGSITITNCKREWVKTMEKKDKVTSQEVREKSKNSKEQNKAKDKINLDYDWNSEYGDGDIPDIDK